MRHERKTQRRTYIKGDTTTNRPPSWRVTGQKRVRSNTDEEEQETSKRRETVAEEDKRMLLKLEEEFERRLRRRIRTCEGKDDAIQAMFKEQTNIKQLERGVVTSAEKAADYPATTIEKCLKRVHNRDNVKTYERWNKYTKDNFQRILSEIQEGDEDTIDESEPDRVEKAEKTGNEHTQEVRTCTARFNSIIRKDLPDDVKGHIRAILSSKIEEISDYAIEYSVCVRKFMLLFATHTFVLNTGGSISVVEKSGFGVEEILPAEFEIQGEGGPVAPPLDVKLLANDKFNSDIKGLFNSKHFNALHTLFFGVRKTTTTAFDGNLCHKSLHTLLPKDIDVTTKDNTLSMKLSMTQYEVDFKNMWSNKRKSVNLLNRLLEILLRQHLAPSREEKRSEFIKKKTVEREKDQKKPQHHYLSDSIPVEYISIINKTKNGQRSLFCNEKKRRDKYQKKAKEIQAEITKLERIASDYKAEEGNVDWNMVYEGAEDDEDRGAIINEYYQEFVETVFNHHQFESENLQEQIDNADLIQINQELDKLEKRAQMFLARAARCDERLKTYNNVLIDEKKQGSIKANKTSYDDLTTELEILADTNSAAAEKILVQDEQVPTVDGDASRSRIKSLASVMRQVLYKHNGKKITTEMIKLEMKDITLKELDACIIIVNLIMPYIPDKAHYYDVAVQLPFFLMANKVLKSIGYNSRCSSISPMPTANGLHSLQLDAPSLVSIFSSSTRHRNLNIYDMENKLISSRQSATELKREVFSSFFDINQIDKTCSAYGLEFNYVMYVLPQLEVIRLVCSKEDKSLEDSDTEDLLSSSLGTIHISQPEISASISASIPESSQMPVIEKSKPSLTLNTKREKRVLELNEEQCEKSITKLQQVLSGAYQERRNLFKKSSLSTWKKQLIKDPNSFDKFMMNQVVSEGIDYAKTERHTLNQLIQKTKIDLKKTKCDLYQQRKQKNSESKNKVKKEEEAREPYHITKPKEPYIGKAEDTSIDWNLVKSKKTSFSGTDNGLVTMSETVGFSSDRFQFHLDLYNRYSVFDGPFNKESNEVTSPSTYLSLPKSFKIKGAEIDHCSGQKKLRRKMERQKRKEKHRIVTEGEADLAKVGYHHHTNITDFTTAYDEYKKIRKESRELYYGKSMMKAKRKYEVQKKTYIDRLCEQERRFAGEKNGAPIMFIGDRGHGFGSRLKGFKKYGGFWKQKQHSGYTSAIITNEYHTSQICIFCFGFLQHPMKKIENKSGKEKIVSVNGSFQCENPNCISYLTGTASHGRDQLSSLSIGLSGLSTLLFDIPFPCYKYNISHSETEQFKSLASSFSVQETERVPAADGSVTLPEASLYRYSNKAI